MPLHLSPFALSAEQRPISDRSPPGPQEGRPLVVLLRPRPQRPGETREIVTPGEAVLLPAAGVVTSHRLLPELVLLVWVLLASAAFYHGVEFAFELFRPPYIHPSTPVHFSRTWTLTLVLPAYLCRRTPVLGQRLDAPTG